MQKTPKLFGRQAPSGALCFLRAPGQQSGCHCKVSRSPVLQGCKGILHALGYPESMNMGVGAQRDPQNPAHPGVYPPPAARSRPAILPRGVQRLPGNWRRRRWLSVCLTAGLAGGLCKATGESSGTRCANLTLIHLGHHPPVTSPTSVPLATSLQLASASLWGGGCGSLPNLVASSGVIRAGPYSESQSGGSPGIPDPQSCHLTCAGLSPGSPSVFWFKCL